MLRGSAERKIQLLREAFGKLQKVDIGQVTLEQTTELQGRLDTTRVALEKYHDAIVRCQALQGGEHDPKDEHLVTQDELEDNLDSLGYKIHALMARVEEEQAARTRAEASAQGRTHEQQGNMGRVVAKPPPPMEKDITLDELETWSSTWEDYYQVTKLEKELPALQKPNFKSYLSVEHVLGIGPDSTKTCDKILGDLCNQSLDDRILSIKIMTGLSDHESREELLDRVSTPELEEANGAMRLHEDPAWTWMVKLYSRSVIVTVFDRGKSPQEDTGRSPREDFDMTKHDMTNCCLVGWREG